MISERLARTYDDLEARIERLAEEEELASMRPDLDGQQIMAILKIEPGPAVGRAYQFLLERRMDDGFNRVDARFDALQRTMILFCGGVIAGLIGLIATQL